MAENTDSNVLTNGIDHQESDGNTSFLRAARNGQLEKVLEHLKTNIDINTSNANGLNALHLASKDGHVEIVEELLKRGAIVDAATKKGNTALHIASLAGQEEVVKLLVQHGASVNVQSQNGFTPLYMAAQENHDNVVKFLLANGANQSLSTEDGFTPLAVAMQQGHDKVVTVLLENDTRGKVRLPALHIAAKKDDVRAAKLLLENDHNPDVTSKSGFTPLHIASHYGNQSIANLLIQKGADVNYSAKHNITPLHVAAKWGKSNMVSLLLEQGAHIEAKTRDGLTPLHCAARSGHEQVVDMLLEKSAPISSKTKNGLAPLHMAAQGDHVDAARILLYHRAPVDEVTVDYLTALHVAAHCGHVRVAKLLLDRQADANARALNGFTPLHIACKKNRIKVVELLLKHGACIGATTESGLTPLHVASFMGCMNIVIYLLQHDASPDIPTVRGETPLHLAARANQTDIIRILLRNGAQVDARAREQQTPLHIASRLGNVDIVMLLLQHGAKVDNTTKDMYTALHIAAKEGQDEVAAVLIENGASLNATTKKGFTPLHLAAKYGHLKVAKLLVQKEAPVDAQGKNGVTPLHVASHYDHQNVALLLLDKGASPHANAKNGHTPLHIAARKNQMDIAHTLLEYGAHPDAESKAGFTPLHLSSQEGHADISALLLEHKATPSYQSKNGLTPMHLCAQENKVAVAEILHKNGAEIDAATKAGYTPLHIASHYGQTDMVKFLLSKGADVKTTTTIGYTPLHQAAQQGHANIVNVLLENSAQPNAITNNGQTPLHIAQKLGYITVIDTLKEVTEPTQTTAPSEEKYRVVAPEAMHETFLSDSEEEGEDTLLGDQTYRYLTADEMKSLGDDSLPIDVTRDERIDSNRMVGSDDLNAYPPRHIEDSISPEHIHPNYIEYIKKTPDNIDISRHPVNIGFLVSFLVDARGGAMRGCRHSGVRVIVPPRCAPSPTRITCRYVRPQRTPHPPPLMEGEALASRVLELGPVGAKFLGPVIIEVPHFAALRGKEREIVILRSDNGESWKEHTIEATEDVLNEVLRDSFDIDDLNQLEDTSSGRITRIITQDFPQYFAVISRIRQEVHAIGPEGGMVSSTVVPQVQAVFPQGALTKKIKVGLQAQPIDPELTAKLLGHGVAVSPVVTVEPRRRKFHKAITLSMPAPRAHSQGMINQYSGSAPTLRLLCSITGGTSRAQWEDVTGSTPLTFVNDCVSFTTTVSARFWLMDCRNIGDATKMATELYREAIHVPFIAKFVVFAKRTDPLEARLRVFCMTDDKEEKTLEYQEQFTEIAKSRDVEVLEGKSQYIEFAGNLVPITKSGEQLQFSFRAFKENRFPFSVRVKDQHAEAVSRCLFMREPKVQKGEPPQQPICILNIVLPDDIVSETISLTDSDSIRRKYYANENFDYYRQDPRLADISNLLGEDWVKLANQLGLTSSEINVIKSEYPDSVAKQAQSMLRMWLSQSGNRAQTNTLDNALRRIGREDIVHQCLNVDNRSQQILRLNTEEKEKQRLKDESSEIISSPKKYYMESEKAFKAKTDSFDKYSAEEKTFEPSDEEEDFNKTVPERREQIVKRLSTERTIPASSQRVEIVQEISSIKRQSLVEDKIAEVQQKANIEPMKITTIKPVSKIIQEKQILSEFTEVKTTVPSDQASEKISNSEEMEMENSRTIVTNLEMQEPSDRRDSVLLEEVTHILESKKPIPKLIADEDPKSPKFSRTPPPSPADFIMKEKQATTAQEWGAAKDDFTNVSKIQPETVEEETKGKTTSTQYLDKLEQKLLDKTVDPSDVAFPSAKNIEFHNFRNILNETNAFIQFELKAEPYDIRTETLYKTLKPESKRFSEPQHMDKKSKKGFLGSLKSFVSKSSEKTESDEEIIKQEKLLKKIQTIPKPSPVTSRKARLPTPPECVEENQINISRENDLVEPKRYFATTGTGVDKVEDIVQPPAPESEDICVILSPDDAKKTEMVKEILIMNVDESIKDIERDIFKKDPRLNDKTVKKPSLESPVIESISKSEQRTLIETEPVVSVAPDQLISDPEYLQTSDIEQITLIKGRDSVDGWADEKNKVSIERVDENETLPNKTKENDQKIKDSPGKLFGLFSKTSKDKRECEDSEIIEKQDREISKESPKHSEKRKKYGLLGFISRKSKKSSDEINNDLALVQDELSENHYKKLATDSFLLEEKRNYDDAALQLSRRDLEYEHEGSLMASLIEKSETAKTLFTKLKIKDESERGNESSYIKFDDDDYAFETLNAESIVISGKQKKVKFEEIPGKTEDDVRDNSQQLPLPPEKLVCQLKIEPSNRESLKYILNAEQSKSSSELLLEKTHGEAHIEYPTSENERSKQKTFDGNIEKQMYKSSEETTAKKLEVLDSNDFLETEKLFYQDAEYITNENLPDDSFKIGTPISVAGNEQSAEKLCSRINDVEVDTENLSKNMSEITDEHNRLLSGHFLEKERHLYNDVRCGDKIPIKDDGNVDEVSEVKLIQEPCDNLSIKEQEEKGSKGKSIFKFFDKKSNKNLQNENEAATSKKQVLKEKSRKERILPKLFSKKSKSSEEETTNVQSEALGDTSIEPTHRSIDITKTFLKTEIEHHHDVKYSVSNQRDTKGSEILITEPILHSTERQKEIRFSIPEIPEKKQIPVNDTEVPSPAVQLSHQEITHQTRLFLQGEIVHHQNIEYNDDKSNLEAEREDVKEALEEKEQTIRRKLFNVFSRKTESPEKRKIEVHKSTAKSELIQPPSKVYIEAQNESVQQKKEKISISKSGQSVPEKDSKVKAFFSIFDKKNDNEEPKILETKDENLEQLDNLRIDSNESTHQFLEREKLLYYDAAYEKSNKTDDDEKQIIDVTSAPTWDAGQVAKESREPKTLGIFKIFKRKSQEREQAEKESSPLTVLDKQTESQDVKEAIYSFEQENQIDNKPFSSMDKDEIIETNIEKERIFGGKQIETSGKEVTRINKALIEKQLYQDEEYIGLSGDEKIRSSELPSESSKTEIEKHAKDISNKSKDSKGKGIFKIFKRSSLEKDISETRTREQTLPKEKESKTKGIFNILTKKSAHATENHNEEKAKSDINIPEVVQYTDDFLNMEKKLYHDVKYIDDRFLISELKVETDEEREKNIPITDQCPQEFYETSNKTCHGKQTRETERRVQLSEVEKVSIPGPVITELKEVTPAEVQPAVDLTEKLDKEVEKGWTILNDVQTTNDFLNMEKACYHDVEPNRNEKSESIESEEKAEHVEKTQKDNSVLDGDAKSKGFFRIFGKKSQEKGISEKETNSTTMGVELAPGEKIDTAIVSREPVKEKDSKRKAVFKIFGRKRNSSTGKGTSEDESKDFFSQEEIQPTREFLSTERELYHDVKYVNSREDMQQPEIMVKIPCADFIKSKESDLLSENTQSSLIENETILGEVSKYSEKKSDLTKEHPTEIKEEAKIIIREAIQSTREFLGMEKALHHDTNQEEILKDEKIKLSELESGEKTKRTELENRKTETTQEESIRSRGFFKLFGRKSLEKEIPEQENKTKKMKATSPSKKKIEAATIEMEPVKESEYKSKGIFRIFGKKSDSPKDISSADKETFLKATNASTIDFLNTERDLYHDVKYVKPDEYEKNVSELTQKEFSESTTDIPEKENRKVLEKIDSATSNLTHSSSEGVNISEHRSDRKSSSKKEHLFNVEVIQPSETFLNTEKALYHDVKYNVSDRNQKIYSSDFIASVEVKENDVENLKEEVLHFEGDIAYSKGSKEKGPNKFESFSCSETSREAHDLENEATKKRDTNKSGSLEVSGKKTDSSESEVICENRENIRFMIQPTDVFLKTEKELYNDCEQVKLGEDKSIVKQPVSLQKELPQKEMDFTECQIEKNIPTPKFSKSLLNEKDNLNARPSSSNGEVYIKSETGSDSERENAKEINVFIQQTILPTKQFLNMERVMYQDTKRTELSTEKISEISERHPDLKMKCIETFRKEELVGQKFKEDQSISTQEVEDYKTEVPKPYNEKKQIDTTEDEHFKGTKSEIEEILHIYRKKPDSETTIFWKQHIQPTEDFLFKEKEFYHDVKYFKSGVGGSEISRLTPDNTSIVNSPLQEKKETKRTKDSKPSKILKLFNRRSQEREIPEKLNDTSKHEQRDFENSEQKSTSALTKDSEYSRESEFVSGEKLQQKKEGKGRGLFKYFGHKSESNVDKEVKKETESKLIEKENSQPAARSLNTKETLFHDNKTVLKREIENHDYSKGVEDETDQLGEIFESAVERTCVFNQEPCDSEAFTESTELSVGHKIKTTGEFLENEKHFYHDCKLQVKKCIGMNGREDDEFKLETLEEVIPDKHEYFQEKTNKNRGIFKIFKRKSEERESPRSISVEKSKLPDKQIAQIPTKDTNSDRKLDFDKTKGFKLFGSKSYPSEKAATFQVEQKTAQVKGYIETSGLDVSKARTCKEIESNVKLNEELLDINSAKEGETQIDNEFIRKHIEPTMNFIETEKTLYHDVKYTDTSQKREEQMNSNKKEDSTNMPPKKVGDAKESRSKGFFKLLGKKSDEMENSEKARKVNKSEEVEEQKSKDIEVVTDSTDQNVSGKNVVEKSDSLEKGKKNKGILNIFGKKEKTKSDIQTQPQSNKSDEANFHKQQVESTENFLYKERELYNNLNHEDKPQSNNVYSDEDAYQSVEKREAMSSVEIKPIDKITCMMTQKENLHQEITEEISTSLKKLTQDFGSNLPEKSMTLNPELSDSISVNDNLRSLVTDVEQANMEEDDSNLLAKPKELKEKKLESESHEKIDIEQSSKYRSETEAFLEAEKQFNSDENLETNADFTKKETTSCNVENPYETKNINKREHRVKSPKKKGILGFFKRKSKEGESLSGDTDVNETVSEKDPDSEQIKCHKIDFKPDQTNISDPLVKSFAKAENPFEKPDTKANFDMISDEASKHRDEKEVKKEISVVSNKKHELKSKKKSSENEGKEEKGRSILGFFRRSRSKEKERTDRNDVEEVILKNIEDCKVFLENEVQMYHDVKPYFKTTDQIIDTPHLQKDENTVTSKFADVRTQQYSDDKKSEVEKSSKKSTGIFKFLKKTSKDESKCTDESNDRFKSEKYLIDTDTFIKNEIENFEDVLPVQDEVILINVSENQASGNSERETSTEEGNIVGIPEYSAFDFIKEEVENFEKSRQPFTHAIDSSFRVETEVEEIDGCVPKEIITKKIIISERLMQRPDEMSQGSGTTEAILEKLMDINKEMRGQVGKCKDDSEYFENDETNSEVSNVANNQSTSFNIINKIIPDINKEEEINRTKSGSKEKIVNIEAEYAERMRDLQLAKGDVVEDVSHLENEVRIFSNSNQEKVTDLDDSISETTVYTTKKLFSEVKENPVRESIREFVVSNTEEFKTETTNEDELRDLLEKCKELATGSTGEMQVKGIESLVPEGSPSKKGVITKLNEKENSMKEEIQVTQDFIRDLKIQYHTDISYPADDMSMVRTVSDNTVSKDKEDKTTEIQKISATNMDLSNLRPDEEGLILMKRKLVSSTSVSPSYITSPTMIRRTLSQKGSSINRPEVKEVHDSVSTVISENAYIVTDPNENITDAETTVNICKRKPLFRIESDEDDFGIPTKTERRESVKSNILETLSDDNINDLLSDLDAHSMDPTEESDGAVDRITTTTYIVKSGEVESECDVALIEEKLRNLGKALDELEKVNEIGQNERDEKREKKLKRVERKFERMASEVLESTTASEQAVKSPDSAENRQYQQLVSQLSTDEVITFQNEYSNLWDDYTFSKSDGWDSKTPDSQADVLELPQGDGSSRPSGSHDTSTLKDQYEESSSSDKHDGQTRQMSSDQHQLSEEMKELLKEMEKTSKE